MPLRFRSRVVMNVPFGTIGEYMAELADISTVLSENLDGAHYVNSV